MEKRRSIRQRIELEAVYSIRGGAVHTCQVNDFSRGGLFLSYDDANQYVQCKKQGVKVRDPVKLVLTLDQEDCPVEGRVAHFSDVGVGVQFVNHSAQLHDRLEKIAAAHQNNPSTADRMTGRTLSLDSREKLAQVLTEATCSFLFEHLGHFQTSLLDAFVQAADRQKADAAQHPFLDAIALFNKHGKSITESLIAEIRLLINEVSLGKTPSDHSFAATRKSMSSSSLSLVDKEEFEDWLIVRVVSSRAETQFREPLLELQLRLEVAYPHKEGKDVDNPFAPGAFCKAFQRCVRHFKLGQSVERVVFRVLQEQVINHFGTLYKALNKQFADAGVLPNLDVPKYLAGQKKTNAKTPDASPAKSENVGSIEEGIQDNAAASSLSTSQSVAAGGNALAQPLASPNQYSHLQDSLSKAKSAYSTASRLIRMHRAIQPGGGQAGAAPLRRASADSQQAPAQVVPFPSATTGAAPADATVSPESGGVQPVVGASGTGGSEAVAGVDAQAKVLPAVETQVVVNAIDRLQMVLASAECPGLDDGQLLDRIQSQVRSLAGDQSAIGDAEQESIQMMDQLFQNIVEGQRIADPLKPALRKLQVPLLKALFIDPALFANDKHPARQTVNTLALLSDKDSANLHINQQRIIDIVQFLLDNFDKGLEVFDQANEKLDKLADREKQVIKRNVERVTEACRGQEKVERANEAVEHALKERLHGTLVPLAIVNLIDAGWRELMRLSYIREGEESRAWLTTLQVVEQLVGRLGLNGPNEVVMTFSPTELIKLIDKGLSKIPPNKYNHKAIINELEMLLQAGEIDPAELVEYKSNYSSIETDFINRLKSLAGDASEKSLLRWVKRARSLEEGQWLEFDVPDGNNQLNQLAWVSDNYNRFVFVNHLGMKVCDLALDEIAIKLKKGEVRVLGSDAVPAVDQGLDSLVQKFYDQLAFEAAHDQLTRLVTRKEFERCLARSVARTKKNNETYLLCYFDVTQFKVINNTCGYEGGDALLKEVATRVQQLAEEHDVMGRLGGDEFGILCPVSTEHDGYQRTHRFKAAIEAQRFVWGSHVFTINVSMAYVVFDKANDRVLELLRGVESAVEIAKQAGHTEIQAYRSSDVRLEQRDSVMAWVARINAALDSDHLRLRCQMIAPVDDDFGAAKPHYEILLTVLDEQGEHMPPAEFIKAAEEYSRMAQVDRWVINQVLGWMQANPAFLDEIGGFAINLSGHSMNDDSFMDFIFERLVQTDVPRRKLIFEVTETTAVANLEDAADFITEMKEIGCRFSLDDFGAGQSSYAYLKSLPVDFIKIDGSFVRNIANDDVDYAMVKSITDMGHFLEKKIVAEFVLDEDVYETVADIGVDYVQGYHIGKPVYLDELNLAASE